ncbi:MAG: RICIN domain-containing protein [Eubacteriales bacterium]|nr:RICIN domain-containing protein [Eubacteriales bacterium]
MKDYFSLKLKKVIAVAIVTFIVAGIFNNNFESEKVVINVHAESIFTCYSLSDTELRNIAGLCQQEQGTAKGAAAEASLMANIYELNGSSKPFYEYVRDCGWWYNSKNMDSMSASSQVISAVKDVLINGRRILPGYINEHDYLKEDIASVTNNGVSFNKTDKTQYVPHVTKIHQATIHEVNGKKFGFKNPITYTFYCFPTDTSDPFGYTDLAGTKRDEIGEAYYDFDTKELINPPVGLKWYYKYPHVNLGDKFTAYIINTEAWKHLTSEENDNVIMTSETRKAGQMWNFTRKADGSYRIINCKTGKALDGGGAEGNLYTYESCDNNWQSWDIYGSSGEYYLKCQASDYVIDILGASTEDGANAQIYEHNASSAQKFQIYMLDEFGKLEKIQNLGDKFTAYIINKEAWKHITVEDNDNVMMTSETRKAEQMWNFVRKADGSYRITNCRTGKALDAGGTEDNIYTYEVCDNAWQSWYIFGSAGSYYLKSQGSNGIMDVVGGQTADGINVQLYTHNDTVAQKFAIYAG